MYYIYLCNNCGKINGTKIPLIDTTRYSAYRQITLYKNKYEKRCLYCQNTKDFQDVYTGDKGHALMILDKSTGIVNLSLYTPKTIK